MKQKRSDIAYKSCVLAGQTALLNWDDSRYTLRREENVSETSSAMGMEESIKMDAPLDTMSVRIDVARG